MGKDGVSFQNRDTFIQLGIVIATLRKIREMTQDQLAEKANISRSHLSAIEAPGMVRGMSLDAFLNIAAALDVAPEYLIRASLFPDDVLNRNDK